MQFSAIALELIQANNIQELPRTLSKDSLIQFLYDNMTPYEDPRPAIERGIDFALSQEPGEGGFVMLAFDDGRLVAATVMVKTGLDQCVPPNLLLFAAVLPGYRGRGIGTYLINRSIAACDGDVKLHVEYDNPARRLYEKLGFVNKYADMRYSK